MAVPMEEAVVLGVVQGLTEILPVSSDGHAALLAMLSGRQGDAETMALLHTTTVGTLAAVLLVFRRRVADAIGEGLRGLARPSLMRDTPGGRDALVILLASVPTMIVAVLLRDKVEVPSSSLAVIGACLLVSAAALISTHWAPRGASVTPRASGAVLLGVVQGAAVLPGLSRTAVTLAALVWLGVRPDRAFDLSFLISLPAGFGALLLGGREGFGAGDPMIMLASAGAAFGSAVVGLLLLRRVVTSGRLAFFALYLVPLAVATLAWSHARP